MTATSAVARAHELDSALLEGIPSADLRTIVAAATKRRHFPGQILIHAEDHARNLYLMLSGRVRHYSVAESGQRLVIRMLIPGEAFGIQALVPKVRVYSSDFEMEAEGELLVWDAATIQDLAERFPSLYRNALTIATEFLTRYHAKSVSLATHNAEQRLAYVLGELSHKMGRRVARGVELQVTNENLASMANINLFTTSRLLSSWQKRGDIVKGRGKIVLRSQLLLNQ